MDLDSYEVQAQYQDHADLVPLHLNLKHVKKYHNQKEMEECVYRLMLRMMVNQTIDILQTEHFAL